MAFYRGQQGTVFFDKDSSGAAMTEIAAVRSWSMTVEKETYDATSHGATYRANIGGLISGSGSIEVMYDAPTGDKLDLIKDVNQATDEANAAVELYLDESGAKKITGTIVVTSTEYSATVGEIEIVTINFVSSGTLTLSI